MINELSYNLHDINRSLIHTLIYRTFIEAKCRLIQ